MPARRPILTRQQARDLTYRVLRDGAPQAWPEDHGSRVGWQVAVRSVSGEIYRVTTFQGFEAVRREIVKG